MEDKRLLRVCMTGFGNVGQKFCVLLEEKKDELERAYHRRILVTGIATRSKGSLANPDGLSIPELLRELEENGHFDAGSPDYIENGPDAVPVMMDVSKADVFIEMSTLSIADGQPAAGYIEAAFDRGMHVITANKGPEAWHFKKLNDRAEREHLLFLYETIVMDGTPVFNLVKETLHGNRILGMRGILNSTSNYIFSCLKNGLSYEDAVRAAQERGIAEADPSLDMDGWDGAAKICALANILMDAGITPEDVAVESAAAVTAEDFKRAEQEGQCIKYLCEAMRDPDSGKLHVSVKPVKLPLSHPFATVDGTSAAITLYTDLAGELTILQTNPGLLQTAYGVYSDLITLLKTLSV